MIKFVRAGKAIGGGELFHVKRNERNVGTIRRVVSADIWCSIDSDLTHKYYPTLEEAKLSFSK